MKYVIVVAAGIADEPQERLNGATPLEAAATPNLDAMARAGRVGRVRTVPEAPGMDASAGLLSILGYDPRRYYTGRGAFEAKAVGWLPGPDEWALCCDLVTLQGRTLVDFSAGHIGTAEAGMLLEALAKRMAPGRVRLAAGFGHRGAMVVHPDGPFSVTCVDPVEAVGRAVDECLPSGEGAELLRDVMEASTQTFAGHEVNRLRLELEENPACMVWPWGPARAAALPAFASACGLSGAAVCAANYVRGIAESIGWRCIRCEGATGRFDTNYAGKSTAALEALAGVDLVLLHVESAAAASLEGDVGRKVRCIEDIDAMVVGPLRAWAEQGEDRRIMVVADCAVHVKSQRYGLEPVPFLISRQRVGPPRSAPFTEKGAEQSALEVTDGHQLLPYFLAG